MVGVGGNDPPFSGPKPDVLPLNDTPICMAEEVGNDPTQGLTPGHGLANQHDSYPSLFLKWSGWWESNPPPLGSKPRMQPLHLTPSYFGKARIRADNPLRESVTGTCSSETHHGVSPDYRDLAL
jgi:hypothetical protein